VAIQFVEDADLDPRGAGGLEVVADCLTEAERLSLK
jgi:hypothetical protein